MDQAYIAVVTDTADPDMMGRIKVASADLLGDEGSPLPMWVDPLLPWGWFLLPNVGDEVEVIVATDGEADEVRGQTSVMNPSLRWVGWKYSDEVDPVFKVNYGQRRGFRTKSGTMYFDDSKAGEVVISCKDEKSPNVSKITLSIDGTVTITGTKVIVATQVPGSIQLGSGTAASPLALALMVLANMQELNTMIQGLAVGDAPAFVALLKAGFATWLGALQDMADPKLLGDG
jgi:hypothetical protein